MVGFPHDGFIVLDHDNGVTQAGQSVEDGNEAIHIARVKTDGWLVEDEERIDE
jgi:hypothetical protein